MFIFPLTNIFPGQNLAHITVHVFYDDWVHNLAKEWRHISNQKHQHISRWQGRDFLKLAQILVVPRGVRVVVRVTCEVEAREVGDKQIAIPAMIRLARQEFPVRTAVA